jgi:hypothetical protein
MIYTYQIKPSDSFSENMYPEVIQELLVLRERSLPMQSAFKTDIVISFLKDHCIKVEWLAMNGAVCKLITSGSLSISHLESLFSACRTNILFLKAFEECIKVKLA